VRSGKPTALSNAAARSDDRFRGNCDRRVDSFLAVSRVLSRALGLSRWLVLVERAAAGLPEFCIRIANRFAFRRREKQATMPDCWLPSAELDTMAITRETRGGSFPTSKSVSRFLPFFGLSPFTYLYGAQGESLIGLNACGARTKGESLRYCECSFSFFFFLFLLRPLSFASRSVYKWPRKRRRRPLHGARVSFFPFPNSFLPWNLEPSLPVSLPLAARENGQGLEKPRRPRIRRKFPEEISGTEARSAEAILELGTRSIVTRMNADVRARARARIRTDRLTSGTPWLRGAFANAGTTRALIWTTRDVRRRESPARLARRINAQS